MGATGPQSPLPAVMARLHGGGLIVEIVQRRGGRYSVVLYLHDELLWHGYERHTTLLAAQTEGNSRAARMMPHSCSAVTCGVWRAPLSCPNTKPAAPAAKHASGRRRRRPVSDVLA